MAEMRQSRPTAALDDMLAETRKRFDALHRGPSLPPRATAEAGAPRAAAPLLDAASSPAVRRLNERFGGGWHFEIAARHREGGEAIVMVKLILDKDGTVKTQFGRAKLEGGPVEGQSAGLSFRLAGRPGDEGEIDACRRAAEAALMKCAELV
jgi:hypothetical protein